MRGKATQSSQFDSFSSANNAIDGNNDANFVTGSCTHTKWESEPWWRLDLQEIHNVTEVTITNRQDCCSERISGAEIRIGNSLQDNGNRNPRYILTSLFTKMLFEEIGTEPGLDKCKGLTLDDNWLSIHF